MWDSTFCFWYRAHGGSTAPVVSVTNLVAICDLPIVVAARPQQSMADESHKEGLCDLSNVVASATANSGGRGSQK